MAKERADAKPAKPDAKADAAETPDAPAAKKKSSRKLLLVAGLLVTLAAGGSFAYQQFAADAPAAADGVKGATAKTDPGKPPQFVSLEPLTVNLRAGGGGEQYLQVGLAFQVSDPAVAEAMKQQAPVIRSNILLLLTSKSPTELGTLEGKNALSAELLAAAREPLPGGDAAKGVSAVHYTSFIIQ